MEWDGEARETEENTETNTNRDKDTERKTETEGETETWQDGKGVREGDCVWSCAAWF